MPDRSALAWWGYQLKAYVLLILYLSTESSVIWTATELICPQASVQFILSLISLEDKYIQDYIFLNDGNGPGIGHDLMLLKSFKWFS